ncbi:MAG: LapA family protein [Syntrophomonadaceae bacterium]|nr:LapA family protein [Syntrophomonadaceae bacterium]
MQAYLVGALFFLLAIAIFVFQNTEQVIVHFITWTSPEVSLAVVVLISACTGALITFLLDSFRQFKIARRIKELSDQNVKLQKKINRLENTQSKNASHSDVAASKDKE